MDKRIPIRVARDFGGLDPEDAEFDSIEDFVEFLWDDERNEFDWRHLNCLAVRVGRSNRAIRKELEEEWGLRLADRRPSKSHRGYRSNPNDRWYGPGSEKTHGGSGWEEITGMAGQKG